MVIELSDDEAEIVALALEFAATEYGAKHKLDRHRTAFYAKAADICRGVADRLIAPQPAAHAVKP